MIKFEKCNINELCADEYQRTFEAMSPERKSKVERLKIQEDKKRTVAGEYLARKLISGEENIGFEKISIVTDDNGKPYAENSKLHFSISHSDELVCAVVSDKKVGVDAEKIHDVRTSLTKRVCTERELAYIYGYVPSDEETENTLFYDSLVRFFEIWTFKEAYFKCVGTGITDFKSVDFFDAGVHKEQFCEDEFVICVVTLD